MFSRSISDLDESTAFNEEKSDDSKDSFYEEFEQVFFIIFPSTI
jgi:hypothetical protein